MLHATRTMLLLAALVVALAACVDTTTPSIRPAIVPPVRGEIQLFRASIDNVVQTVAMRSIAPRRPAVRLVDSWGHGVDDVEVRFAVTSGSSRIDAITVMTQGGGYASVGWTMGTRFETTIVTATVAGLPPIEFRAQVIAPLAGSLAFVMQDPVGDTLAHQSTGPVSHDLAMLRGEYRLDTLILTAQFTQPLVLDGADPASVSMVLEFDLDDRGDTGPRSLVHLFGAGEAMGVDAQLLLVPNLAPVALVRWNGREQPVPTTVMNNLVVLRIPMSALGSDDGEFTLAGHVGRTGTITDIVPNSGSIAVRR